MDQYKMPPVGVLEELQVYTILALQLTLSMANGIIDSPSAIVEHSILTSLLLYDMFSMNVLK